MKKGAAVIQHTLWICILTVLLSACGGEPAAAGTYTVPPFQDSGFHADLAQSFERCQVDFSGISEGYIALVAQSDKRLKFRVSCGEYQYVYALQGNGSPEVIPLNMGNGDYSFELMENATDNKYMCIWEEMKVVNLKDEFQPFLRPSQLVPYDESSRCVALAKELAAKCDTDADLASAIYKHLVENIAYDYDKAAAVRSGYLPVPDETLATGKGICFDYASLAASMLRSMGIPCKMIFGNVMQGGAEVYHAWNVFYLKNQGWITAEIKASPDTWQRVDITFAAGGQSAEDLMNDALYTQQYSY